MKRPEPLSTAEKWVIVAVLVALVALQLALAPDECWDIPADQDVPLICR